MAKEKQSYSNHTRWDPKFHFVAMPLLFLNVVYRVSELLFLEVSYNTIWEIIFAVGLVLVLACARIYALQVQDRIIRLEERLRLQTVLPEPLRSRIGELTEPQLVGLRFASDAELPGLVEKTLSAGLGTKQIKQAIQNWRPDEFRV